MVLNTPKDAESSAILYSIAETAKANNFKPYEYFWFLLDEIAEHLQKENLKLAGANFGSGFIFA